MKRALNVKRLWLVITAMLIVVFCTLCFVACGSKHTHNFVDYYPNDDATCGKDGTETALCTVCGQPDTRVIPNTATGDHNFVYEYNDDATCDKAGTETGVCSRCGDTDKRIAAAHPATGNHSFVYKYNDDANCGVDGTETGKCSDCDATNTRTKPNTATGEHDYRNHICFVCGGYDDTAPRAVGLKYAEVKNGDDVVGYSVTGIGECTDIELYIPDIYNGKSVIEIEPRAFQYCSDLMRVIIPNTVKKVGYFAFSECTALIDVVVSNSVTSFGNNAFYRCDSMQFNASDNALYIGNAGNPYAVLVSAKDKQITSCEINENTKVIADYAFDTCQNLTSIDIPNGVVTIGESAFTSCGALASVSLPDSLVTIGVGAFRATALTEVVIPNRVTVLSSSIFRECSELVSVTLPNGLTDVRSYIFRDCVKLTELTLPATVTYIGERVLFQCSAFKSLKYVGTTTQWSAIRKDMMWNDPSVIKTVECVDGTVTL